MPEAVAPASLVAELSLGDPKETWRRLRLLGGDQAQALPSSLPVLLATSLSLPPTAAGVLDETLPLAGVLLAHEGQLEPDVVLGMHVLSGQELVASLTLGDSAKFRRVELGPRVVRLLPAPGAPELDGALGVSGNYLLLASRAEALGEAGRFVAEKVARRARTAPGVVLRAEQSVVAGALSRRLREAWQGRRAALSARDQAEREAKGRAPDFADPEVLLAGADNMVESWLAVLESAREISLSLTPEADRLRVELELSPAADGAAQLMSRELVVGASAPLLALPASARAGLLLRGEGGADDGSLGASLSKLFGSRLDAAESARLTQTLERFSRARRGSTVLGLVPAPVPALLVTCELIDERAFSDSLADVLRLFELAPVRSWLAGTLGKPSLELTRSADGTRRAKLRFARAPGLGPSLPKALSVSWWTHDGTGTIVVSSELGLDPSAFAGGPTLGALPWLAQPPLAEQSALALFVDARLLAPGGPDDAPIWLAFGKKSEQTAVTLDVSAPALSALARRFALDRTP